MKVVLLLAAGAAWETRALGLLSGRRDLVVLKRCVDVDDLLATATSGQADTAVVAIEAPGFDLAAVDHLVKHGVRAVAVVGDEPGTVRASRIGVRATVHDDDLEALPEAITTDHQLAPEPPPTPDDPPPSQGRVIAVWGPAGAPGRTTVATALAARLGSRARTTLVDADPYGGTVAQALGRARRGLRTAVGGPAGRQRDAGGAVRQRPAGLRPRSSPWSPGCHVPTAGPRSAPAPSSSSPRSRAGTATS